MSKPFTPKLLQVSVAMTINEETIVGVDAEGTAWVYRHQSRRSVDGGLIKPGFYWAPLVATVVKGEMEVES